MLHDVRPFNPDFFPQRYIKHSFLTDKQFIRGLAHISDSLHVKPSVLFNGENLEDVDGAVLTFDDGLKDHFWVAKMLLDIKVEAIFFIPFGVLFEKKFINSHLIQFLNACNNREEIARQIEDELRRRFDISTSIISEYRRSRWKVNLWTESEVFITRILREFGDAEFRKQLLYKLVEKYITVDLDELHEQFYLSKEELSEIARMGHVIGSHGYYSLDMRYEDSLTVNFELQRSCEHLEIYQQGKRLLSYPNGGYSGAIIDECRSVGYDFGMTTLHRAMTVDDDPFMIPRLDGTKMGIFV